MKSGGNKAYSYGLGENCWYFGVDGLDKKSEIYRIGSNFEQVWETMKMNVAMNHPIVWQYIIFNITNMRLKEFLGDGRGRRHNFIVN